MSDMRSKSMMDNGFGMGEDQGDDSTSLGEDSFIIDINTTDLSMGPRVEDPAKVIQRYQRRRQVLQQ
jgi:hypothetical protein